MIRPTHAGVGLVRLSDSDFVPANPEDDLRGKDVYDAEGQRIGSVEDLYIERKEREVRFLEVGAGGFLRIGEKRFLVPVEAVVEVAEDRVTIEPERTQKVEGSAPFDTKVAPRPAAEERRADDYASPPYGDTGRTADRLDMGGMDLLAAEDTSPTTTMSKGPRAALSRATQQGAGPLPEMSTTPAALSVMLKWAGVALLVIASLMAVYLGAGLLRELAVWVTYP